MIALVTLLALDIVVVFYDIFADPFLNLVILTIEKDKFVRQKYLRQDIKADRNTNCNHNWERNSDHLDTLDNIQQSKQTKLDTGVHVHLLGSDVSGEWCLGILVWLHEQHKKAAPKLVGAQAGNTHIEEHPIEDWYRNQLENWKSKDGSQNQTMDEQVGQSSLKDPLELSFLRFVGQSM